MVQISKLVRRRLGELLVEAGVLREEQLREAQLRQRASGEGLIEVLASMNFVPELDVARVVAKQFGLPYLDPTRYRIPKPTAEIIPAAFQWQNQLVVLDRIGRTLLVAVAGVLNAEVLEKLERVSGCQLFVYAAAQSRVVAALEKMAPSGAPATAAKAPTAAGKK